MSHTFIYLNSLTLIEKELIYKSENTYHTNLSDEQIESLISLYCSHSCQDNQANFEKLLHWKSITITDLKAIFSVIPKDYIVPSWLRLYEEFLIKNSGNVKVRIPDSFKISITARDKLSALVSFCSQKIRNENPTLNDLVHENAFFDLLEYITIRLLQVHFELFSTVDDSIIEKRWEELYQDFPVLCRITFQTIEFFLKFSNNLISRLKTDISDIEVTFNKSKKIGRVKKIVASLSDPHNEGNCVLALEFDSNTQVIYKPRDLSLEVAYQKFLTFLNSISDLHKLRTISILNKKTHGWIEFITKQDCLSKNDINIFYQKAGKLTCILHFLKTVDCHYENFIATGSDLIFIDIETIMHHDVKLNIDFLDNTDSGDETTRILLNSVLRTGILPRWNFRADEKIASDISLLGAFDDSTNIFPAHIPSINGEPISVLVNVDDFILGFSNFYKVILNNKTKILESHELAELFKHEVRFIFRPTRVYWAVLRNSLKPCYLKSGINRSIYLSILSRAFLVSQSKPKNFQLLSEEISAVEQLDIPSFKAKVDEDFLPISSNTIIESYFKQSSKQNVIDSIKNASNEDLLFQIELIKGTIFSRRTVNIKEKEILPVDITKSYINWIETAEDIAKEIIEKAIIGKDGSAKWISFEYSFNSERFQLSPLRDDLYNGNGGIAIFLSALYSITGKTAYKDLALSALMFNEILLQKKNDESIKRFLRRGIGGAIGISSNIYSLVKCSELLSEPKLISVALQIAKLIDNDFIRSDDKLDVINGAAGAILCLTQLNNITKDKSVSCSLIQLGEHLISKSTEIDKNTLCWNVMGKNYTGFSHGSAGISYSLYRLFDVCKLEKFKVYADRAINYENSLFNVDVQNWVDLRTSDLDKSKIGFGNSWCHGAPGIGLSRIGIYSISKNKSLIKDIEVSTSYCNNHNLDDYDCICCGNFGRIEVLQLSDKVLGRNEFYEIAQKKINHIIQSRKDKGFRYPFIPSSMFLPSFFQGLSGIGYSLLKQTNCNLPSILLWE